MSRYKDAVDRDKELTLFDDILAGRTPQRIMLIQARAGMGKSYLLSLLMERCRKADKPYAWVDFRDVAHSYYEVVTLVQRDVCVHHPQYTECFTRLEMEIRLYTHPPASAGVSMGQDTVYKNVQIGSIVGGHVFSEGMLHRPEVRVGITMKFIGALQDLTARRMSVIFVDTYEQADPETRQWLEHNILRGVERIRDLVVVVAGREVPSLHEARPCELEPLTVKDYQEYAQRIGAEASQETIAAFHRAFKGEPEPMTRYLWNLRGAA